jgi:SAM-dependent MidA family methyltransferase
MSDNLELIEIIVDRINNSSSQQITFAEYMELVLYQPTHGYYASSGSRISTDGDFLTSPHLADDFGQMLAIQLYQMWQIIGSPQIFSIVEMGAGQGLLAAQILDYAHRLDPNFLRSIDYLIIEIAPAMISVQQARLSELPVRWCEWKDLPDKSIVGCFLSNELIDALPVHQITVVDHELQEIYVTVGDQDTKFVEKIDQLSTAKLAKYWDLNKIDLLSARYPDNYQTEVNLAGLSWLEQVNQKLHRGYVLSIDYGYTADRYYNPMRTQGTLQCYYQHAYHNDPYLNIGNQDLTAHVDFTAIQNQGEFLGLHTIGLIQQGMFLMALGLGERIAAISTSGGDIQSLLRRRQHLHQLIDPMGLGKFGVLIQSQGLTAAEQQVLLTGLSVA